jgi:ElaB/YqjD/DUF883 family membrane-anchored ribosome-binding protein
MGERDDAQHQVERTRERMSAIAQEVSRRMTPGYAKERAKEMARERAYEVRDRAVDSPWMLPLLGAGIGALVGRAILGRAQERREAEWRRDWDRPRPYGSHGYVRRYERSEPYGEPRGAYGSAAEWDEDLALSTTEAGGDDGGSRAVRERLSEEGAGAKERIASTASELGDRASEVKERVTAKASELGDRARERAQALRERLPDRDTIRESAYEQPGMWALGALAAGALFGFALPLSEKEREVLAPAKERVREATTQAMDRAVERVERMGGEEGRTDSGSPSEPGVGAQPTPGTTGLLTDPTGADPLH